MHNMALNKLVQSEITWLSSIGSDEKGGTTRLLYDSYWKEAQDALKEKFEQSGLSTHFDTVGNLYGTVKGSKYPNETILSGSHVDTVVNGGQLDGQFGIIAAYLAIKSLVDEHGIPLRNLEVVSMAEEEGSRFPFAFWGSKNIFGMIHPDEVRDTKDASGVSFEEAMKTAGFRLSDKPQQKREDIKAFVELHIEQGNVLEKTGKQVAVVNNIVGQKRFDIRLYGQANHAGTTPMGYRHDTVYAMSRMITEGIEIAKQQGDPLVLTFGHIEVLPNTVNVVPGEVFFTMDCRHTDQHILNSFVHTLEQRFKEIAKEIKVDIAIDMWMDEAPVPMSPEIVTLLEEACTLADLNYMTMHSGAGHDSQIFAQHVPTAMLFVPSINGISHNPEEATHLKDLVEGVKALKASLYQLAYKE